MSQQKAVGPPQPSEIAGRYQVVSKLGAGAFGTVYKAMDKVLGRMVAIKTIRLEGLAAQGVGLDELVDRFQREARVSAQLKHPNIVTIYDVGEADGMSYLAMEFIDGVGLERIISGEGHIPLERAAALAAQVADALDFAHKHSVVHRDIKPANIMVEAGDRVKVTDFGIAKVTNSGDHLTVTGSLLGTPSYMSPEQARGAELDGRSDLFAVGCILYEMLTGKKAFRGESITGLIFKIITEEPPPIRDLDPGINDETVRIITKALSKSPDARYQTGRELADDLLALTRPGATPTIRQVEMATAAIAPGRAGAAPASTPTVNSAAPTQAGALPTHAAPPPRPAQPPAARSASPPPARALAPTPAPRKSNAGIFIGLAVVMLGFLALAAGGAWFFFLRPKPTATTADTSTDGGLTSPPPDAGPGIAATLPPATSPPSAEIAAPSAVDPPPASGSTLAPTRPRPVEPETARNTTTSRGPVNPPGPAPTLPSEPVQRGDFSALDQEQQEAGDGREAGERLANAYKSDQPGRRSGGNFGASGRFQARERSPRNLRPPEMPAVATLRFVMNAEEGFKKRHGRYGTFEELARAQMLPLDVAVQRMAFSRRNYRFDLTLEDDGFRVAAIPLAMGPRPFHGDDSGYIQAGLE